VRLEPLCHLTMRYIDGTWLAPFGEVEAAGFGSGDGAVSGAVLNGAMRWANSPRKREDGVWTPNLRGVIRTDDGADLIFSMRGQSVEESTEVGLRRAILLRIELLTEHESYRWLNTAFVVAEGEIDEETEEIVMDAFVCVNELVQHAPALGDAPPEQFRQGG